MELFYRGGSLKSKRIIQILSAFNCRFSGPNYSLDAMNASGPAYALRTTWGLLVLIYSWAVLLVIALATAKSWMPPDEGAALFLAVGFIGSVVLLACFSFAAVGWTLWSFRGRSLAERRPSWLGLLVALITFALSTGYLLLLTGLIRR